MGRLKIHCCNCGCEWDVYHRDNWKDWKSRTCPSCGEEIDPETWENQILNAFGEMEESNIELQKDHDQQHKTMFLVGYMPDIAINELEEIRREIDALHGIVGRMIDGIFAE